MSINLKIIIIGIVKGFWGFIITFIKLGIDFLLKDSFAFHLNVILEYIILLNLIGLVLYLNRRNIPVFIHSAVKKVWKGNWLMPATISALLFPISFFVPFNILQLIYKNINIPDVIIYILILLLFSQYPTFLIVISKGISKIYQYFYNASKIESQKRAIIPLHPNLVCKKHLLRTKKIRRGLLYIDVRCRYEGCDNNEYYNVKKVIGVVGPLDFEVKVEGDNLLVNLWSEGEAKNSDIDFLEIREGLGNVLEYEKAIQAIILKLTSDVSREKDYFKKNVEVLISGNPEMTEMTYQLLRSFFKNVRRND